MKNLAKTNFANKTGILLVMIICLVISMDVYSQLPPPPPPPPPSGTSDTTTTTRAPIEGGLVYLLSLGIVYGLNMIRNLKKKTKKLGNF